MTFKAVVIGLGAIGLEYDYECNDDTRVLTHAQAYHQHPGFELVAGVDANEQQAKKFEKKFGVPAFSSIEALESVSIDLVSICTPTGTHFDIYDKVEQLAPRLVLCEKPLSHTLALASNIVDRAEQNNICLAVNYFRRFEPGVQELKRRITENALGDLLSGIVWYKRGMLNNASHFIDLLIYCYGLPDDAHIINHSSDNFYLSWGAANIQFCAVESTEYNFFEMHLVCSRAKVAYIDGGARIELRNTDTQTDLSGRQQLQQAEALLQTDFFRYQYHVQQALYKHLLNGENIASTGKTALDSLTLILNQLTSS